MDNRMGTTRVNLRLPADLLEKADVVAAVTEKTQSEIIVDALQEYLAKVENDDTFNESVVELYIEDQISFEALNAFVGRQDAESIRASKALLDQGDDTADDLANRYS